MTIELTDRELEIVELVGKGFSYSEIGEELECSPRTVETHVNRVYSRLRYGPFDSGVPSRTVRDYAHSIQKTGRG